MWGNDGGFGQSTQSGGYYNSQSGFDASQSAPKSEKPKSIIPCTISQIKMAEQFDDIFKIGDVKIHQVTIVGLIRRIEVQATCVLYELHDMTSSPIEIRQWNDTSEGEESSTMMHKENTYVKVAGTVRVFNNKRILSVFKILPVIDLNEITMHMLEVTHSHMRISKGLSNEPRIRHSKTVEVLLSVILNILVVVVIMLVSNGIGHSNSMMVTPVKGGGHGAANGGAINNGLTGVQSQVHQLINSHGGDQIGISLNTLCSQLKGVSQDAIRNALEFLSNEGHIYSTIDDDHFKSTDG